MYKLQYDKVLLWGFIWILLVSMVDHYLAIKLQDVMLEFEWNPLGILFDPFRWGFCSFIYDN